MPRTSFEGFARVEPTPRVRLTATARRHVSREQTWWVENRIHTNIFADEIEVSKVACHLYDTFDEREVIVRAFWGARRRRGPHVT